MTLHSWIVSAHGSPCGTRKGDRFPDKSHFTVFDCFDGTLLEYFRKSTAITADPPEKPARSIVEIIEDIWANRDRQYNGRCLVKRLQRIDKEMAAEARELFEKFIPQGDMARFARELPARLSSDFTGTMALLRDKAFQALLLNYPRKPRVFYVAYATEDKVESEWLIRDGKGNEYKPEDYLTAFYRYVRQNKSSIEAIRILLNRPRQWSTDSLIELRRTLASAPERFTVENLQRVHSVCCQKALADLISMVKHAAFDQEPLLTAEERVDRAMAAITAGQTFKPEQQRWLDRIREHLITNLSIDREDFDTLPIFARDGGWGVANRIFENNLQALILRINEAISTPPASTTIPPSRSASIPSRPCRTRCIVPLRGRRRRRSSAIEPMPRGPTWA